MKIRLRLLVVLLSTMLVLLAAGNVFAILGACVNCHTMHNSQDGEVMTFNAETKAGGMLLRGSSCGGCHADFTANTHADASGIGSLSIPQIDELEADMLAGGSFRFVVSDDAKGHNVKDLGIGMDGATFGYNPPGFNSTIATLSDVGATWNATNQLTCSGTYGCHGDHTEADVFAAVNGAHHGNAGGALVTADTVGNSYRFLLGIKGTEDPDWEATTSAIDHNVYFGRDRAYADSQRDTISSLCAQCHGNYHTQAEIVGVATNMSSPWVRHPSDIDMHGLGGDYSAYTYSTETPVALSTTPALADIADTLYDTEKIVICLSCHRAHGSDQPDLLRFDYTDMIAGNGFTNGCFNCHSSKN